MHNLLPSLLPRLHQVCGKSFYFTTGGIVVENVILHKIILFSFSFNFILFYFNPYLICYVVTQDVRSDYIRKVIDVMTFFYFILFYLFYFYSIFLFLLCCPLKDVRSDYICKVIDAMKFYIGRWSSQLILYCLYIMTAVESQDSMLFAL